MIKNGNALSLQSKEWILEALLELMDKKSYRAITVKEITERAGLDRKTFYRNFDTKEDVLRLYLDMAYEEYRDELSKEYTLTRHLTTQLYFSVCQKHIGFFEKLVKHDLFSVVLNAFDDYWPPILKQYETQKTVQDPLFYSSYAVYYRIGGFWYVTAQWIRDGAHETPEEMANVVESLLSKQL